MRNIVNRKTLSETFALNSKKYSHEEYQYLNLIDNILENGIWEEGRNGKTKSVFGASMRFSLKDGKIPILTTKKVAWKTCLKELLWFIRGETDNKILKEQDVHIWDANCSREFLDSRGLNDYEVDELGPIYGYQWRQFNKPFFCESLKTFVKESKERMQMFGISSEDTVLVNEYNKIDETGIDQLQKIIDQLKNPETRNSRRLIMTAWNPGQLNQMALPPCHVLCQFNVHDGNKLSCALYQRSCDFFLGIPINIASYSFLTHLLAKHCGLEAYEFIHFMGNVHLYENAIDAAKLQLTREPFQFTSIEILNKRENISHYEVSDFKLTDYNCHDPIKVEMVA
jgi:thymidylate synthase